MGLIDKRVHIKPVEYPIFEEYVDATQRSYWTVDEYNLTTDVADYNTNVNEVERSAIKNCMLAISQVEVAVKSFFMRLPDWFPKPELANAAATFAESEVRHQRAYSHLLELLGLNKEFEKIYEIPAINDRMKFLEKYVASPHMGNYKKFMKSLAIFSIFTEHVSLFSQFLILTSFNYERNLFKGTATIISSTRAEEDLHGKFIIDVLKILREENPEWFDDDFYATIYEACRKAFRAEQKMLDWIFEAGELDFLPREVIEDFIRDRFNTDLKELGMDPIFEVDQNNLDKVEWFRVSHIGTEKVDFFATRPTTYSLRNKSITADDLF